MSDEHTVEQELQRLVSKAEAVTLDTNGTSLVDAIRSDPYLTLPHAALAIHSLSSHPALQHAITQRFRNLDATWFDFGTGPVPIRQGSLATALLRVAITDGAPAATKWLSFVREQQQAEALLIMPVWGVSCETAFPVSNEITLCPVKDLPDSYAKRKLLDGAGSGGLFTPFDYEVPKCAFIYKTLIRELQPAASSVIDASGRVGFEARRSQGIALSQIKSMLAELALLLGVLGPQISLPAMSWITFSDQRIERLRVGATRFHQGMEIIPLHIPESPPLEPIEVAPLVRIYLALQPKVRAQLHVGLERLSMALRRHDPADRAVELSIALESLLSDRANNEVTHKVNVRAVRLLGGDADVRARHSAIIRATYTMRSKLVHQGERSRKNGRIGTEDLTPQQITDACAKICAAVVTKIATIGSVPDWSNFDIS